MSPIAHCEVALAARRLAPKAALGILLIAATFLDLLILLVGIERAEDQLALNDYPSAWRWAPTGAACCGWCSATACASRCRPLCSGSWARSS